MGNALKLAGQRFGMLTVTTEHRSERSGAVSYRAWLCSCDCGKELWVRGTLLTRGRTSSCGCRRRVPILLSGPLFARLTRLADLDRVPPMTLALQLLDQGLAARGVRDPNAPRPPVDPYII